MRLLEDEIAFLERVRAGYATGDPVDEAERLIVQVLVGYQLVRSIDDQLRVTDRGVQILDARIDSGKGAEPHSTQAQIESAPVRELEA